MYYTIYFEITSIIILLIMLIGHKAFFKRLNDLVRRFIVVIVLALITCTTNIIAALCYDSIIACSDKGMLVIETVYLLLAMFCCYAQLGVICLRMNFKSEKFRLLNYSLLIIASLFLLINVWTGYIFEYVDHAFIGHTSFYVICMVYVAFFIEMLIVLILKRDFVRWKILVLTSTIFFYPVGCMLIQFINDRLLLTGLGGTLALLVFSFTLDDADYEEYQSALNELNNSKDTIKSSRTEIEKANRVKSLFMKKISSLLDAPIKEIQDICNVVKVKTKDEITIDYINKISEGGNEISSFMQEIAEAARED